MKLEIVLLDFYPLLEISKYGPTFIDGKPQIELGALVAHQIRTKAQKRGTS